MGQYHYPVNLDKKEFINPHKLGAGLKLWEQIANNPGVGAALIILLAASNGRGGGDFDVTQNWHGPERTNMTRSGPMPCDYPTIARRTIGRWVGDRVALIGDYCEFRDIPGDTDPADFWNNKHEYTDISEDVVDVLEHELQGRFEGDGWRRWTPKGD